MSSIKFGIGQISNPTPANWSNAINFFTVLISIFIGWLGTANCPVPVHTANTIQSIGGLLLALGNGLKPLLGVETNKTTVPIEQVGEIETNPKK